MKRSIVLTLAVVFGFMMSSYGNILVNDTWIDAARTDPNSAATPPYAENNGVIGTDTDGDGNLESAWFNGTVPAAGTLRFTVPAGSLFETTYFTPTATPVTLGNIGDQLKITWTFTPTTVNVGNTSQGFPLAVANSQTSTRRTTDGTPVAGTFLGYAMFMNMGQTLSNANPFALREWVIASPATGNLLGTSANWGADGTANATLANGATTGNHGYDDATTYTFTMSLTRSAGGLDIVSSMVGGTLDGDGTASVSITDATPNTFTFDTFAVRPSGSASAAAQIDTSLFKVEFNPGPVPEPATVVLVGLGLLGMIGYRRMRR